MTTTYAKLKTGAWGVRIEGTTPPAPGATVVVTKRDGEKKTEVVDRVVWAGNGVALCAIRPSGPSGSPAASRLSPRRDSGDRPVRGCGACAAAGRMCQRCWFDEYDC